ncbi:MAG: Holliday junction resolvase RecU [Solobacterium sp.]|nr:Holliday junction resolvase RecU [Solobacterium sp.]MBQ1321250.1 Holliday junction resolvase RecU [Solobacterium sp.]MBQ1356520.1 Holliday junction resolvase RecU [Solobacterium sp.]
MVNYPDGRKARPAEHKTGAGGRGMELEKEINLTNSYYLDTDRAVIHKKPTPVTIVKVDYPMRTAAKITEAYFKVPSTTDYNGIYRGKYLDFEAKECASKTSFPIKSIHEHQIRHLDSVIRHGAIAFVIVRFTVYGETYYVDAGEMNGYIRTCGRSSIPYKWFQEHGILIPYNYVKPVDYLQIVDQRFFKENAND